MATKNKAKKSTKSNTMNVWATVDRSTNELTRFFGSRTDARTNRLENETVRGYTLVPKK